ncbi:MAG: hypothetical protein PHT06_01245, partial [Dehalococcoidales bacterium]|nr:hypothetical protein [Dehalococcoidales bacterium]
SQFGSTPEEIFVCYEEVKDIVGSDEIKNIPLGAIGIYSYSEKLRVGLQQIMAGARCFNLPSISRKELMSLTKECAKVTGIPYLMDVYREEAMDILEDRNNGHEELESLGSLSNYAGTSKRFRTYE